MHPLRSLLSVAALLATASLSTASVVVVTQSNFGFSPTNVTIQVGDTVQWNWTNFGHDVSEGTDGLINGNEAFTGPLTNVNPTFSVTFDAAFLAAHPRPNDVYDYFCSIHFVANMKGKITVDTDPSTLFCFGDGTNTACPCSNSSTLGGQAGCANSLGSTGAKLRCSGTPSVSSDTISLNGSTSITGPGLYFQGTVALNGGLGNAFGDGLRCVGGANVRLGIVSASGGVSAYPRPSLDPSVSVKGGVAPGDTRHYQLWYRDSATFCSASTFNLTNGATLTWAP